MVFEKFIVVDRNFLVEIPDRQLYRDSVMSFSLNAVVWYTDQHGGCGAYDFSKNVKLSSCLGKYATVFPVEVHAIELISRSS